ncbi:hypothetical protein UFOVP1672_29 [uncultured Caudovirales phage]|uniref:DUF6950 domain-containing protein n=1 Tax=uncultured Caudovirales phage TaxID=2100421 RepID=A0A6J5Q5L4_9CAUD|nr:hypothetical protein UFOVP988_51 [uncultured Caudovirales phage]CAB4210903.1 hypothetical protein UFOVP1425_51 [uncultured Caudovirales phage]CAB4223362.1 hypothetical protein UFOVP1672_29 [uncultured Caudovirales phage]
MRFQDWPSRLDTFTREASEKKFEWGVWDCGLSAAKCVEALTGVDAASEYLGKYSTAEGSVRTLKKVSGGGLREAFTRLLGEPLESPKLAQRGDICLFETPLGDAVGWCIGPSIAATGPDGLTYTRLKNADIAWRVS